MRLKTKIAFWCYFTAIFSQASAGVVYISRKAFMPYHEVAVGMPWVDVPSSIKVLIVALMRIWGGTSLIFALALFILLFIPFRESRGWSFFAIPFLMLTNYAAMSYAMAHVDLNTPANPPWSFIICGVLLTVIACVLSVTDRNQERDSKQR